MTATPDTPTTTPTLTATTTAGAVAVELLSLPISDLAAHPANLRFDLGDVSDLAASIAEHGLIEPVVVAPLAVGGGYRIVAGHRRTAACQRAGLTHVPAIARPDLATVEDATSAEHIGAMLAENTEREALTTEEIAAGIVQLAAFPGMTPAKVARKTNRTAEQVKHTLAAAQLPQQVRSLVHAETMTLDDAAALAQLEDDPKVYARVLAKISGGGNAHYVIADERRKQATKTEKATATAKLKAAGCPTVAAPGWEFPARTRMQPLSNLRSRAGKKVTTLSHKKCAGHAAFLKVDEWRPAGSRVEVSYVCTDPETNGHTLAEDHPRRDHRPDLTEDEAAALAEQAEALRSEWATAAEVRRGWLGVLLRGKTIPDSLARAALGATTHRLAEVVELLTGASLPDDADDEEAYAQLVAKEPVARLHRHTVAYYTVGQEHSAARLDPSGTDSWRGADVADWLRRLAAVGYPLSEVEQTITSRWPAEPDTASETADSDAEGGVS